MLKYMQKRGIHTHFFLNKNKTLHFLYKTPTFPLSYFTSIPSKNLV